MRIQIINYVYYTFLIYQVTQNYSKVSNVVNFNNLYVVCNDKHGTLFFYLKFSWVFYTYLIFTHFIKPFHLNAKS